jgi:hypothetical protein
MPQGTPKSFRHAAMMEVYVMSRVMVSYFDEGEKKSGGGGLVE